MECYCCSGKDLAECCQPFLEGMAKPATAEELMRSRYTAHVTAAIDYLRQTTHPSTRKFFQAQAVREWAESNRWQKLEITSTSLGGIKDKQGTVEFKAYYLNKNAQLCVHHEHSNFAKELGKWFFVDGRVLKSA
jgi:SEC-C motif-containing protein